MIDSSNLTRYVLEKYGRKRQDLSIVIPMIIIYIIIFITGVFGNVATCLIIAKNRYMQVRYNLTFLSFFFLFYFILSVKRNYKIFDEKKFKIFKYLYNL